MLALLWTGMVAARRDGAPVWELCSYAGAKHSDSMCHMDQICQKPCAVSQCQGAAPIPRQLPYTPVSPDYSENSPSLSTQPGPVLAGHAPQLMAVATPFTAVGSAEAGVDWSGSSWGDVIFTWDDSSLALIHRDMDLVIGEKGTNNEKTKHFDGDCRV